MSFVYFLISVVMFGACLHHANEMSGKTPKGLIIGLVCIMVGDLAFGLIALYQKGPDIYMIFGSIFIFGLILWFTCERRHIRRGGQEWHPHN